MKIMGADNDPSAGLGKLVHTEGTGCSGETEVAGPSKLSAPSTIDGEAVK